jgi:hypothetical protein
MSLYSLFLKVEMCLLFSYKSLNNGLCPFKISNVFLFSIVAQQWFVSFRVRMFLFSINRSTMVLSFFKVKCLYFPIKLLNNEAQYLLFFEFECLLFSIINNEAHCLFKKSNISFSFPISAQQWLVSFFKSIYYFPIKSLNNGCLFFKVRNVF